jgi:dienelactone hydrolase
MTTRADPIEIAVDGKHMDGTLVRPDTLVPGVLLVHGWDGSQAEYLERAREIAALGCVCLTFDLRGHERHRADRESVTREDNLRDVLAAYDLLARRPEVDREAIAVVGSSYGGYLAAILTTLRPVRWLALRVPALYDDEDWHVPKNSLPRDRLAQLRRQHVEPGANRALGACAMFRGEVLIVESEHDSVVPHPAIESYKRACAEARSVTYRVISDADHALSEKPWQQTYTSMLVNWLSEMLLNARAGRTGSAAVTPLAASTQASQED